MSDPDHPVKFSVNLVEVDAVVTDSRGNHIDDLSPDEFEILQDGKPQKITHFQFVPAPGTHGVAPATSAAPMATSLVKPQLHRTFAVYIDDVHMSFSDFVTMRKNLLKFVDYELEDGDLWAFYKTSGGSGAWQTFSSDRREIRSAVEHMKWLRLPDLTLSPEFFQGVFEAQITKAISSLGALPGRKIMILLNSGMYVGNYPGSTVGSLIPTIQKVGDAANRASVTIEAIDLRGLPVGAGMPDNWADASHNHAGLNPLLSSSVIQGPVVPASSFLPRPAAYLMSQSVAERISGETGGLFLHDRNDFYNELKTAENDDAGYYLIGWDPGAKAFEGKRFNNLSVKVHRHGLSVRSRAGFFPWAGSPGQPSSSSVEQQMQAAIFSPFRSGDIDVELDAGFQHTGQDGSYIESQVHVAPAGIRFVEKSPGCYTANLEILTMAQPLISELTDPGHLTSQMTAIEVCGGTAQTLLHEGFVYKIRSRIERPGPYEMRVAVRNTEPGDQTSLSAKTLIPRDRNTPEIKIGSATEFVEVPDLTKKPFALAGIMLEQEGAAIPKGIRTGTNGQTFEMSYRAPVAGDPAVRQFRAGETIAYGSTLFASKDDQPTGEIEVLSDAMPIHSEPLVLNGPAIQGTYHIDPETPPGHYFLGITAEDSPGKKNGRAAAQWIDFEVVK